MFPAFLMGEAALFVCIGLIAIILGGILFYLFDLRSWTSQSVLMGLLAAAGIYACICIHGELRAPTPCIGINESITMSMNSDMMAPERIYLNRCLLFQ